MVFIAFLIFLWILAIHFVSGYIKSNVTQNWDEISAEKISLQSETISKLFDTYQTDVNNLSEKIISDPDIARQIQRSESKKLFEELSRLNLDNSYQVEIYNTRLELLTFKGRKLDSDIYSLQRCLNGNKFSVIKEIGFYTYLIVYSPVYDLKNKSQITGVLLTAKLIDIKYQINNKFFQNTGFLSDINKIIDVSAEIIPANTISGKIDFDSSLSNENVFIDLKGIDGKTIGVLLLPKYSQITHIQNIDALANSINSLLVFGITVILFLVALKFLSGVPSYFLRFVFFTAVLIAIRFIWLEFHFPSKTIESEIFSPGFYASTFGYGIARSVGELFITSVFILIVSLYGVSLIVKKKTKSGNNFFSKLLYVINDSLLVIAFFIIINLFEGMIQSIIFDSNLKFFDRASIIPTFALFIIQLIILLTGFAVFTSLSSIIILICKNSFGEISRNKFLRKYFFFILLVLLLVINQLLAPSTDNFSVDNIYRIIIIILTCSFGVYLFRKLSLIKNYNVFTVKNFSFAVLFCIIVIPGILLEKITSQETYYVELIGRKISEKEDDRIKFLLVTELSNISESRKLEGDLKNKNKLSELAFSVWTDSKFSEENFNTAVIVLDTNKKLLSDFIFNSENLNTDSIIKYADNDFFKKKKSLNSLIDTTSTQDTLFDDESDGDEDELAPGTSNEDMEGLFVTDKIVILKNSSEKYYLGIVPIEKIDLKNTMFNTGLGYLLIAVQYESKNFQMQYSMQLFKNYFKDNLFDKLISGPIITEYIGGEIVSSTNQDLSKSNTLSLDAFREAIRYKNDKSDWRYEIINNERYRTFYILASPEGASGNERIYSISLKRNDFKLTTFFYLKFILFAVFVYLITLAFMSVFFVFKIKNIRLNFREKLFASFFIVSVIPIVLLAIYTRSFIKTKYDTNFQNQLISDLNLVSQSIKGIPLSLNNLDSLNSEQNQQILKSLNQSDKNFNLYLKTKLVSTTNEELYKSDLLDTRVDADAYYNIIYSRKDFFSKTEEIGVYSFIVGYKPLLDSKNNMIGLISSQTVYRQNEINEELTEILTFIFGIYFIVIIILLFFVTFLTDRISKANT